MAWSFDEINDSVDVADDAACTLGQPAAYLDGWGISFWMKMPSGNAGSFYKYIFSWGTVGAGGTNVNLILRENSASSPDEWDIYVYSASGNGVFTTTSGATAVDDGAWHHIILNCYEGTTADYVAFYIDGSNILNQPMAGKLMGDINVSGNPRIGGRIDGNADRYYGGYLAEFAVFDFAPSLGLGTLAPLLKFSPLIYAEKLQYYLPMIRNQVELVNNLTLTNNGSTVANDHPPVIYPHKVWLGGEYVSTGSIVPGLMSQFRRRRLHPCAA